MMRAARTVPTAADYTAPFRFAGGTIDRVVVDVSGQRYIDHEAQVRGWFMIDWRSDRASGTSA